MEAAIVVGVLAVTALFAPTSHESGPKVRAPRVLGDRTVAPAPGGAALDQTVTVARPVGQLVVEASPVDRSGHFDVSITDTRDDDPGWQVHMTVTDAEGRVLQWSATSVQTTPAFTDAGGVRYAQRVSRGDQEVLASARAGHGLGIARVEATTAASGPGPLHISFTTA